MSESTGKATGRKRRKRDEQESDDDVVPKGNDIAKGNASNGIVDVNSVGKNKNRKKRMKKQERRARKDAARSAGFIIDTNGSGPANEVVGETAKDNNQMNSGASGLRAICEARASHLYDCRPVFVEMPSSYESDEVLLCGHGPKVRCAAVRTGKWLYNLNADDAHDELQSARAPGKTDHQNDSKGRREDPPTDGTSANGQRSGSSSSDSFVGVSGEAEVVGALAVTPNGQHIVAVTAQGVATTWALERRGGGGGGGNGYGGYSQGSRGGSGSSSASFCVTGRQSLGAPVHSLVASPSKPNRLFALLGRPFAHLDQEDGHFENDDAQAEEEGRGDGPASENDDEGAAGGSTPFERRRRSSPWSVCCLHVKKQRPGDGSVTRTYLEVITVTTSEVPILSMAVMPPVRHSSTSTSSIRKALEATTTTELMNLEERDKMAKLRQKLKKKLAKAEAWVPFPDIVLTTEAYLMVCPSKRSRNAGPSKLLRVLYPERANPALTVAGQPFDGDDDDDDEADDGVGGGGGGGGIGGRALSLAAAAALGVATGHVNGMIYVWYGLMDREAGHFTGRSASSYPKQHAQKQHLLLQKASSMAQHRRGGGGRVLLPAPTGVRRLAPMHWHASAVTALEWAPGGYLLSGGFEGVLLVWRVGAGGHGNFSGGSTGANNSSAKPAFLPRLGGAITHISLSQDGTNATVSTMNNVVRLVSLADRARRWTLRGVSMTLAHLASLPPIDASRFPNNHPSYAPVGSLAAFGKSPPSSAVAKQKKKKTRAARAPSRAQLALSALGKHRPSKATNEQQAEPVWGGGVGLIAVEPMPSPAPLPPALSSDASNDALLSSSSSSARWTRSCRLLVNGHPGSLQWYDALGDQVVDAPLEVVSHNFLARPVGDSTANASWGPKGPQPKNKGGGHGNGDGSMYAATHVAAHQKAPHYTSDCWPKNPTPMPCVTHAAFGAHGTVLVTVDSWRPQTRVDHANETTCGIMQRGAGMQQMPSSSLSSSSSSSSSSSFSSSSDILNGIIARPNLKFWHRRGDSGSSDSSPSGSVARRIGGGGGSSGGGSGGGGWVLNSGLSLPHGPGAGAVTALAVHPFLRALAATGAEDGSLRLWQLRQSLSESAAVDRSTTLNTRSAHRGQRKQQQQGNGPSAAGNSSAAASSNSSPAAPTPESWTCAATIAYHRDPITALAFSPDGSLLAVASGTRVLSLWSPGLVHSPTLLRTLVPPHAGPGVDLELRHHPEGGGEAMAESGESRKGRFKALAFVSSGEESFAAEVAAAAVAKAAGLSAPRNSRAAAGTAARSTATAEPTDASGSGSGGGGGGSSSGGGPVGATKLVAVSDSSIMVWDLLRCSVDWCYLVPVDAVAILPASAKPFTVLVPSRSVESTEERGSRPRVTKGNKTMEESPERAERITPRTASFAVAVNEGGGSGRTAVVVFAASSPTPIFIWSLRRAQGGGDDRVKSMQWVVRADGTPAGIAVLTARLDMRFIAVQHSGRAAKPAALLSIDATAARDSSTSLRRAASLSGDDDEDGGGDGLALRPLSGLLAPRLRVQTRQDAKRVKFSDTVSDTAVAGASTVVAPLLDEAGHSSSARFMDQISSSALPAPSELFAAFLRQSEPDRSAANIGADMDVDDNITNEEHRSSNVEQAGLLSGLEDGRAEGPLDGHSDEMPAWLDFFSKNLMD